MRLPIFCFLLLFDASDAMPPCGLLLHYGVVQAGDGVAQADEGILQVGAWRAHVESHKSFALCAEHSAVVEREFCFVDT